MHKICIYYLWKIFLDARVNGSILFVLIRLDLNKNEGQWKQMILYHSSQKKLNMLRKKNSQEDGDEHSWYFAGCANHVKCSLLISGSDSENLQFSFKEVTFKIVIFKGSSSQGSSSWRLQLHKLLVKSETYFLVSNNEIYSFWAAFWTSLFRKRTVFKS